LPGAEAPSANINVPFVFSGDVAGFAREDADATMPLFHVSLVGRGTANLTLANFDGSFQEPTLTYSFAATPAPVPEPTTILLLGTGLAGIGVRRWRFRKQH
jgi:hypothetical protein